VSIALVELPISTLKAERVVEPVPPLFTAIVVPFQVPEVIVPIDAREVAEVSPERVVIVELVVVPVIVSMTVVNSALLALKIVGKSESLPELAMSVKEIPPKVLPVQLLNEKYLAGTFTKTIKTIKETTIEIMLVFIFICDI
jgi:hypothetical protein